MTKEKMALLKEEFLTIFRENVKRLTVDPFSRHHQASAFGSRLEIHSFVRGFPEFAFDSSFRRVLRPDFDQHFRAVALLSGPDGHRISNRAHTGTRFRTRSRGFYMNSAFRVTSAGCFRSFRAAGFISGKKTAACRPQSVSCRYLRSRVSSVEIKLHLPILANPLPLKTAPLPQMLPVCAPARRMLPQNARRLQAFFYFPKPPVFPEKKAKNGKCPVPSVTYLAALRRRPRNCRKPAKKTFAEDSAPAPHEAVFKVRSRFFQGFRREDSRDPPVLRKAKNCNPRLISAASRDIILF